tara:strand:+ start:620 stop:760 length:141 start_codon:yes stop_codon:yes gene_type:complete
MRTDRSFTKSVSTEKTDLDFPTPASPMNKNLKVGPGASVFAIVDVL